MGPPRTVYDPAGLRRSYHCMLYLSRKHHTFNARAILTVDLADNGGWDIEVLDTPGIHRQQGRLPPPPAATLPPARA